MIHYQLIGAVRDPYIEKNKVELKKERLEELKREIILNCSEKKHYKYKTTTIYRKCYDERTINYTSKKIGIKEGRGYDPDLEEYLVEYDEKQIVSYIKKLNKEFKELSHGFGAAIGYSMITDAIKTIDDAVNEATLDMKNNKEELNN